MSDQRDPEWIALGEASRLLGVDPDTLRRWAAEGRVRVYTTPGGHRRFDRKALEEMVAPPTRNVVEKLAASTRRFVAACVRAVRPSKETPWGESVPAAHRSSFRARGRAVAELLVAYVAAPDAYSRERLLDRAAALGHDYGEESAAVGLSLTQAVSAFTFFRKPVLETLGAEVRRLGLTGSEAALAFADVEAAMDKLLLSVVEGHQRASP